ncbi:hypothetical protein SAMN05216345_101886 [Cupriavidus sp. YR651]|uniref:protein mobC n=1 Tax=Cupriavidus sp. YR651 TaxID=1855315 RepID=UPI000880E38E|nr:protein mobC [Cupriavidus sp. YR651]SDC19682.1 hypothetical protein SAMN05216345_101886 [Cupriavidus sp. YR651]
MKYTSEQIDTIASKLRQMPEVKNKRQDHSKQEAVKILLKEIAAMQKRGYSLDQISETLRNEGLNIATPTLKNYLQRAKAVSKKAATPGKQQRTTVAPRQMSNQKATFAPRPDSVTI